MQTLLHDVDQRINERKSTTLYFSGLMVFLGLLGAFMGLMKTVHSVSDLIGAMDVSGKGGTDSFGKMIEGMKAPLNGMSVGFSSSLFGLMTSMVLGALERCSTGAMKALRNEFEHWLSNMAALESTQGAEGGTRPAAEFVAVRKVLEAGSQELVELRSVLGGATRSIVETRADLDRLTGAVTALTAAVHGLADPRPLLKPVTDAVEDLARNQIDMLAQFRALYADAEADRAHIRTTLSTLGQMVERSAALDGNELHRQLDRMIVLQAEQAAGAEQAGPAMPGSSTVAPSASAPSGGLFGWLRRGAPAAGSARALREAKVLRREVRDSLAASRRTLRQVGNGLDERLARLELSAQHEQETMARLESRARDHQAAIEVLSATLGEAADDEPGAAPRPYTGARAAMQRLRQRLNAAFDNREEEVEAAPRAAPQDQQRYGTTDRGDR